MAPREEKYKKYLVYLKDAAYIIGLLIAIYGWMSSKTEKQTILETTVKYNTEALEKVEVFMERQAELNGKMIQFMEDKK